MLDYLRRKRTKKGQWIVKRNSTCSISRSINIKLKWEANDGCMTNCKTPRTANMNELKFGMDIEKNTSTKMEYLAFFDFMKKLCSKFCFIEVAFLFCSIVLVADSCRTFLPGPNRILQIVFHYIKDIFQQSWVNVVLLLLYYYIIAYLLSFGKVGLLHN